MVFKAKVGDGLVRIFGKLFLLIFGDSGLIINCSNMCMTTYTDIPTNMLLIVAHRLCGSDVERQSAEEM